MTASVLNRVVSDAGKHSRETLKKFHVTGTVSPSNGIQRDVFRGWREPGCMVVSVQSLRQACIINNDDGRWNVNTTAPSPYRAGFPIWAFGGPSLGFDIVDICVFVAVGSDRLHYLHILSDLAVDSSFCVAGLCVAYAAAYRQYRIVDRERWQLDLITINFHTSVQCFGKRKR